MNFDPNTDYYAVLGVEEQASADDIKRAYRKLARACHPDSTGGDPAKERQFKEISTAYEVVGDPARRKEYDTFRAVGASGPGFPGFGTAGAANGGFSAGFGGFDLGDLFSQVFTGSGSAAGGPDSVRWSFSGGDFATEAGPRRARRRRQTGRATPKPSSEVKVEAADGSSLVQRGNHIYSDVRVDIDQAVMGSVVSVPTLKGVASVKIPPGTGSGAKLRLRGKGARDDRGKLGDHYVTVHIDVPKSIDDEAARLLAQFMQRTRRSR